MILKMETLQTFELTFGFSFIFGFTLCSTVAFQALTRGDAVTLFAGASSRTVYA
jgi:hypothetical protein